MKKISLFLIFLTYVLFSFTHTVKAQTITEEQKEMIEEISASFGLDEEMITRMIETESSFKEDAVSTAGCIGLMQIDPQWHQDRLAKYEYQTADLYDAYANIVIGCDYLAELSVKHKDMGFALMVYNQGYKSAKKTLERYGYSSYAKRILYGEEREKKAWQ